MNMPRNLLLVRHGHSEGNLAVNAAKNGDLRFYDDRFLTTPSHQWRLTDDGQAQAVAIGRWIGAEFPRFDRYSHSPFVRTKETAALLGLPGAHWLLNRALRERHYGDMDVLPRAEYRRRYPENARLMDVDPLYWTPPGGESIAHVAEARVRHVLSTLHRECSDQDVIAVTHGDLIWAFRLVIERWDDEQFTAHDNDSAFKVHNGQAVHFTRQDPFTGEVADHLAWVRTASPVRAPRSWTVQVGDWMPVAREARSNAELLASIEHVAPLFGACDRVGPGDHAA